MSNISPTAVVDKTAQLGEGVNIGPGCVIGAGAIIGDNCELKANVIVAAGVKIGSNNRIFANCVLGEEPQITGVKEPETELVIGSDNTLRENVTINRGSPVGSGKTVVGDRNYLMTGVHLGHDCCVENDVLIGNYSQIGGHCYIESNAVLSALCTMHQFVTFGRFAYAGGVSGMTHDIPPFMRVADAYPCSVRGINVIGLQRAGFTANQIKLLKNAYRVLFMRHDQDTLAQMVEQLDQSNIDENVKYLIDFLRRKNQHPMGRYRELSRH